MEAINTIYTMNMRHELFPTYLHHTAKFGNQKAQLQIMNIQDNILEEDDAVQVVRL